MKLIWMGGAFAVLTVTLLVFIAGWNIPDAGAMSTSGATPPPAAISRLTQGDANSLRPIFSPDNQSIAFESNRDGQYHTYMMRADGTEQRVLTMGPSDDRHPSWSHDGLTIVYDSADGTHQDIWAVSVKDGQRRQLTHVDGLAEYAALSPDGRRIAFFVYKDMTMNIWSANADGSNARPLTTDFANANRREPTTPWTAPAWSADNKMLAYTGADGRSIWTMRSDGSDARPVVSDGETNHFPRFLADGRLAYVTEYVPPKYDGAWTNAWALDLGTGKRTLLQEHMSMQGPMGFSGDGMQVLFHSPRAGNFDIYRVNLNAPGGLAALQGTPAADEPAGY